MILDESAIVSLQERYIVNGDVADLFRTATSQCCLLIAEVCQSREVQCSIPSSVVYSLGSRLVLSAGAAGRLTLCGYWSAAAHSMRDLVEVGQLLGLFQVAPSRAEEWFALRGIERKKRFDFGKVAGLLEGAVGSPSPWRKDFGEYSNIGSHPSIEGLELQEMDGANCIGPAASRLRFNVWTYFLGREMMRSTNSFVLAVDRLSSQKSVSERFRWQHAVCEGGFKLMLPISLVAFLQACSGSDAK